MDYKNAAATPINHRAVPVVRDNVPQSCFEIYKDGSIAGSVHYKIIGNEVWFLLTKMSPSVAGKKDSAVVLSHILADMRRRRLGVLPFCPVVRTFVKANSEYLRLVPIDRRARFQLDSAGLARGQKQHKKTVRQALAS
jgi:predicted GNAT family acetyltransferase